MMFLLIILNAAAEWVDPTVLFRYQDVGQLLLIGSELYTGKLVRASKQGDAWSTSPNLTSRVLRM